MPIAKYPDFCEIALEQRPELHERFRELPDGMSELTFAGIYLFRQAHQYRVSRLDGDLFVLSGVDVSPFFILPFGLPQRAVLEELFDRYGVMKCVSASQADQLSQMGWRVWEDRDNFDYLYRREDLASLSGRKLHRKRNLANSFLRKNESEARPLLEEHVGDAMVVLDAWRGQQEAPGDYVAAREALERMEPLQLCGGVFYVDGQPVAYSLGEELARGTMWVTHFEKAILTEEYKGVYQYVNQVFVSILPEKYDLVNREQDLGDPGLRQAKESYKPVGFVKKFRAARS